MAGVYSAVPWAGMFCGALALVTPIQGFIGTVAAFCNSPKFATRVQEFVVPKFFMKDTYKLPKKFIVGVIWPCKLKNPFKRIMKFLPGAVGRGRACHQAPIPVLARSKIHTVTAVS
jgi:hypothetical protein